MTMSEETRQRLVEQLAHGSHAFGRCTACGHRWQSLVTRTACPACRLEGNVLVDHDAAREYYGRLLESIDRDEDGARALYLTLFEADSGRDLPEGFVVQLEDHDHDDAIVDHKVRMLVAALDTLGYGVRILPRPASEDVHYQLIWAARR